MNEKKEAYHLCIRVSCIFLKGANKFYPFIGDLIMVSRFHLSKHDRLSHTYVCKLIHAWTYILICNEINFQYTLRIFRITQSDIKFLERYLKFPSHVLKLVFYCEFNSYYIYSRMTIIVQSVVNCETRMKREYWKNWINKICIYR